MGMGKNPLKFGRRKSSTTGLDEVPLPTASPPVSSFRVLERPEKINLNGDNRVPGVRPVTRPFNSPLATLKGRSAEELGAGLNRGSGGTTTSGSSGYYESSAASARHSSTSTLPSSVDNEREPDDEELFPRKVKTTPMYSNISLNDKESSPLPPHSFTSRAARALSFGNKSRPPPVPDSYVPPVPPKSAGRGAERGSSPRRERAMTTSSYASTAKPDMALGLTTPDFGNFDSDFGNMFERPRSGEKFSSQTPPVPPIAASRRNVGLSATRMDKSRADKDQDFEPLFPPRTYSKDSYRSSPEIPAEGPGSPNAWDRNGSREQLMTYSPVGSPTLDGPPPPPPHRSNVAAAFLGQSKGEYSSVPERHSSPALDRLSQDEPLRFLAEHITAKDDGFESRQQQIDENPWSKKAESKESLGNVSQKSSSSELSKTQMRTPSGYPKQASAEASRAELQTPYSSEDGDSFFGSESRNSTPRAAPLKVVRQADDSLFDSSPLGPASRAIKPQHSRTESSTPKKMTKAQFERLQNRGDASTDQSEDEEERQREFDEYDDEDDSERARQISKQRTKQEANMSVYRQQMKKVTGGGPTDLPANAARPSLDRNSASAPAAGGGFYMGGIAGQPPIAAPHGGKQSDDDDEDVPLGILQAHGFPTSSRPPTRQGESDPQQRKASGAGSVVGGAGQGSLPAFARRLPIDPYFGSSVVNQSNREAMGMAGTPSVYGGAPSMGPMPHMMQQMPPGSSAGHPGGLVGVIAGEERAKAARRGSPNPATGAFGAGSMPLPVNMPPMGGAPGMPPRAMSMGNLAPPQVYTPSGMGMGMPPMPPMPMMPQMQQPQMMQNPQQDSMAQFMQMQMQVMQNMLQMQQQQMGQTPPAQQQQTPDYLGVPVHQRGPSIGSVKAPSIRSHAPSQAPAQGRAMTMMHPPSNRWDLPQGGPRPNSAMPQTYSPSGVNMGNGNGPAQGYSASIAPSERNNIGMPSRYRPVTMATDASGRSNSMSSMTKIAMANGAPQSSTPEPEPQRQSKPTIRAVDKPKGAMKVMTKPVGTDEDEDEGWAEMKKKREDRKKFRFGKSKTKSNEISMDDYYNMD